MQSISSKEAVCQYLSVSWEDVAGYRYREGSTRIPMYATDEEYICATANGKRPSKADQDYMTNSSGAFIEATGTDAEYCKLRGRTIWVYRIGA